MQIIEAKVSEIVPLPFNPPTRTTESGIADLLDSIKRRGMIQPLIVTPKMQLIDGHRRLACAKTLGWQTVWVSLVESDDVADLYVELNTNGRPIKPKDWLVIYLMGGVVPRKNCETIMALKKVVGDKGLQRLALRGVSPSVYGLASGLASYCDARDELGIIVNWMVDVSQNFSVRTAMKMHTPPDVIMHAARNGRPLVFTAGDLMKAQL